MIRKARTALALAVLAAQSATAGELLYALERSVQLPSTDSGWDYIRMEPGGPRLFMARLKDGLTVYNVDRHRVIATVENSVGANGPLLLPEFDRGYVAMSDGSLLVFRLKSLEVVTRMPLASDGGLNSAVYDPATKQVHAIVGTRPSESTWFTLDAASGKLVRKTTFPFRKMDDPAVGDGVLYAPARRDSVILRLDSETLAEQARWNVECNVSKVKYQRSTHRLLAACTGDRPLFFALDVETGSTVARLPIGKGMDAMVLDEQRHRIVTSNGADATLTVIRQTGPDGYELLGSVATRPLARMMHIDERSGRLFVVTADSTLGPPDAAGVAPRTIHPDTFTVLTYAPR